MTDQPKDNSGRSEASDLSELRVRRDSPSPGARDAFLELRDSLGHELLALGSSVIDLTDRAALRPFVHDRLAGLLEARGIVLNRSEKRQLLEAIVAQLSATSS